MSAEHYEMDGWNSPLTMVEMSDGTYRLIDCLKHPYGKGTKMHETALQAREFANAAMKIAPQIEAVRVSVARVTAIQQEIPQAIANARMFFQAAIVESTREYEK